MWNESNFVDEKFNDAYDIKYKEYFACASTLMRPSLQATVIISSTVQNNAQTGITGHFIPSQVII